MAPQHYTSRRPYSGLSKEVASLSYGYVDSTGAGRDCKAFPGKVMCVYHLVERVVFRGRPNEGFPLRMIPITPLTLVKNPRWCGASHTPGISTGDNSFAQAES